MNNISQKEIKKLFSYDEISGLFTRVVGVKGGGASGSYPGYVNSYGYSLIVIRGVNYYAHRLAWCYVYGEMPTGVIDHFNGDRLDNSIKNLVDSTVKGNNRNRLPSTNKFGIVGVTFNCKKKKFRARIGVDGRNEYLGFYSNLFDAACARKSAENRFWI